MTKARLHASIKGRVQGVFFRSNTRKHAQELNITGWVKNKADGSVELVAEGSKQDLRELLSWCKKGPRLARVDDIDYDWKEFQDEFTTFSISR